MVLIFSAPSTQTLIVVELTLIFTVTELSVKLALAHHLTGETAKAIETQKKALALLPEGESQERNDFEARLAA